MDRAVFYFPCAHCGTPMAITDIHAWLGAHPVCGDACGAEARANEALRDPRPVGDVLRHTLALLRETGELVRVSSERAARAESDLGTAAMLSSAGAVFAIGVIPAAIAGEVHAASENAYQGDAFEIEQRLHRIIRSVMALEAQGVPAAQHLAPIVHRYGGLSGASASGMQGVLQHLWHHLKGVYDALEAWRLSRQGPFR